MNNLKNGDKIYVSNYSEESLRKEKSDIHRFIGINSNGSFIAESPQGIIFKWKYAIKACKNKSLTRLKAIKILNIVNVVYDEVNDSWFKINDLLMALEVTEAEIKMALNTGK